MLSLKSDTSGDAKKVETAKVIKDERAAVSTSNKSRVQKFPPGLDAMQVLADQVLHFISMMF